MPRGIKKKDLPKKKCAFCKKDFYWRKKWSRDWNNVKYCSKKCSGMMKSKN